LFAGAGGAALGLHAAGLQHAALVEWDRDACATLRAAGLGPVVEGDVRDLDAIAAVAGERVDVLWSSFPCQAWSAVGHRRGAHDDRNGWPWTTAAVDRFRPAWFLAENVRGLLTHRGDCTAAGGQGGLFGGTQPADCPGCYFERVILPDLRRRFAHVGWWVLDAADYGVPQHRRRVILWAGPAPLEQPVPMHGPGRARPWVSMHEALAIDDHLMGGHPWVHRPSPTVLSVGEQKGSGPGANPHKMQRASDLLYLTTGRRRLTVAECAVLQDFPAGHPWQGGVGSQYRQLGNAVPPRLAAVVGRALMDAAGGRRVAAAVG
jgi:DNA (cytosine-5)-methyltransferase 1